MPRTTRPDARAGFSMLELLTVVAIIGIAAAMAVPSFNAMRDNGRLRGQMREIANVLQVARQRASTTGNNHIVYLSTNGGTDLCGNAFPVDTNTTGFPIPVVLIDDGPPGGGGNCCIDPGETIEVVMPLFNRNWGARAGLPQVTEDGGTGNHFVGSTFTRPAGGAQAHAVLFRPDGVPVALGPACTTGTMGTGAGGVYLRATNANQARDYAVVMTALGAVKIYAWDPSQAGGAGAWTN